MTDEMTRNMSVWWTASEYANKLPAAMLSSLSHPPLPVLNENVQTNNRDLCPLTPLTTPQSNFHRFSSFFNKQEKHCSDRSRVISLGGSLFTKSACRSVFPPVLINAPSNFFKEIKFVSTNLENNKKKCLMSWLT